MNLKYQLLLTALLSSTLTSSAILLFDLFYNNDKRKSLDRSRSDNDNKKVYDESLIREQLSRNYSFLGDEGMNKIRDAFVIVIGLGGVGSWASNMLVRSGVSKIRLIDFDQVTLSSLNRHATAQLKDVGMPKVESVARYLQGTAPWATIEPINELWSDTQSGYNLLNGKPDYVIDAIDHIPTKVALLKYCKLNNIKVISCAGAGAKQDPSRVQIGDMSNTFEDPLARTIRKKLRSQGIGHEIPVVYSTEKPNIKLLPLPDEEFEKGKVHELSAMDDFRVRILPVLGPIPAMFGLAACTHILLEISGRQYEPLAIQNRPRVYEKLFREFHKRVSPSNEFGTPLPININETDLGYVLDEIYANKSVLPPHNNLSKPVLVKWNPELPLSIRNVAPIESKDLEKHQNEVIKLKQLPSIVWSKDADEYFNKKSKEI